MRLPRRLKRYIPALKWGFLLLIVVLGGHYAYRNPRLFSALRHVSPGQIIALLALGFVGRSLQTLQFYELCHALGAQVKLLESYGLVVASSMYNMFAPGRAGLGLQAAYMKSKHRLSLAHFASLTAVSNVIHAIGAGLMGLIACGIGAAAGIDVPPSLLLAFSLFFVVTFVGFILLILSVRAGRFIPWEFFSSLCERIEDGMRILGRRKWLLVKVTAYRMGQLVLGALILWVACAAVGLTVDPLMAFTMSLLGVVGLILPLTPGGLGITEGAIAAGGYAWGLDAETVVLATLVKRALGLLRSFGGGLIATHLLFGDLETAVEKADEEQIAPAGEEQSREGGAAP